MDKKTQEFALTLRAKLVMGAVVAVFGAPMLYAAYLKYQEQDMLMATSMVVLFVLFIIVLFIATGFKIKITDSSLHREALFTPTVVDFNDIEAIHFGSTWSNFHVQSNGTKIFVTKDFEDYETIIQHVIDKVKGVKNLDDLTLSGESETIDRYTKDGNNNDNGADTPRT